MLLRPRTETLWIELRWWQYNRHPAETSFAFGYAALNLAYLIAAVIGMATPAQADPTTSSDTDASFLAALDKAGITYGDGSLAVKVGKRACDLMNEGSPQVDVIKQVSSSNPGFTVDGAAQFTMIAAGVYCPQHMGQSAATHAPASPASPALAPNGLAPEPPPPPPPPPAA